MIVSDISNPLFGIMVKEMERLLRKWDINLFIMNTNEDAATEEKAVLSALSHNVDGLIICPTQKNSNILHRLDQEHVPYVLLGRKPNEEGTSNYVVWDDMQGGYEATKYLLSLGHQRILCLSGPSYISSARERLAGYHKALYKAGIPLRPELIHEVQPVGEDLKGILTDSLALRDGFTAVFAFSDMIAWETVYQLNELGKKVPEDISVVGFDGIQSKMPFPCKLTTILTPKTKMATLVVKTLMNLIYQRSETVTQTTIPVKLIVRDTTRAR